MKMSEAISIIGGGQKKMGYMVSFEWADHGILKGDHFPDKHAGEDLIPTEEEAWTLAMLFANKTRNLPVPAVNIFVRDQDYNPVPGYEEKEIKNR